MAENFKIDDEFRMLIPKPSNAELDLLEDDLKTHGCRNPLIVWRQENILLDGHNRKDICRWNDIPFQLSYQDFDSRDDAKAWVIRNQLGRRNLSSYTRATLALQMEDIFRAKANANRGRRNDLCQDSDESHEPMNTLREIGKIAGVSHDTVAKVKRIKATAVPELEELLASGGVTVHTADEIAKLPPQKQVKLVEQGTEVVTKTAVRLRQDAKKAAQDLQRKRCAEGGVEAPSTADEAKALSYREQCQVEFGTAPGQVWEIRSQTAIHRLMIGDATDPGQVKVLMKGDLADLIVVDPPYNVRYVGKTKEALNYGDDNMSSEEFQEFVRRAASNLYEHAKPGSAMYMWYSDNHCDEFRAGVKAVGWKISRTIIWAKQKATQGRHNYHWQHESCLFTWKPGAPQNWYGGNDKTTVWFVDKPHRNDVHPCQKPLELFEKSIRHASVQGDLIVDLFAGSGTAIEAAHRTGRVCYAMEKDPGYAAVILKRMMELNMSIHLI